MSVSQTLPEPATEGHAVPPAEQMVQLLAGFQLSQALYAAAKLGIGDCLRSGPKDAAALAADAGADARSLRRVLRALASAGVFTETADGLFSLAPLGETLTTDSPASMRDLAIMWMETHYEPFSGLLETVRTGRCAATAFYGHPFFAWLGGHPEHAGRFSRAMANLTDGIKLGAISSAELHRRRAHRRRRRRRRDRPGAHPRGRPRRHRDRLRPAPRRGRGRATAGRIRAGDRLTRPPATSSPPSPGGRRHLPAGQ